MSGCWAPTVFSSSEENLVSKAKALKEEGLSVYCLTGSYGYPSVTLTGDVKKDILFIDEVIGVKLALADHRAQCDAGRTDPAGFRRAGGGHAFRQGGNCDPA